MGGKKKRSPPPAFATSGDWHKHHVILFDDLLDSPAYIALSSAAKEAYTILLQEYKGEYTGNRIVCPYSTFVKKGMRKNTVSRALRMLEYFGFITYESGGLEHQPSIYHFSENWKKIKDKEGVEEAKQKFKKEMDNRGIAAVIAKQGFCK